MVTSLSSGHLPSPFWRSILQLRRVPATKVRAWPARYGRRAKGRFQEHGPFLNACHPSLENLRVLSRLPPSRVPLFVFVEGGREVSFRDHGVSLMPCEAYRQIDADHVNLFHLAPPQGVNYLTLPKCEVTGRARPFHHLTCRGIVWPLS